MRNAFAERPSFETEEPGGERVPGLEQAERLVCDEAPTPFSRDRERMERALESARTRAPEYAPRLEELYRQALALDQGAGEARERMMQESTIDGVPFSVLRQLYGSFIRHHQELDHAGRKELFWKEVAARDDAEGWPALESFVASARAPGNLLSLDKESSQEGLETRYAALDGLYRVFKDSAVQDRDGLEHSMLEMFGVPTMPDAVRAYLDRIAAQESTVKSEGRENENLIFYGAQPEVRVLKMTKDRHDEDFTSVLKVMRDMHAITAALNGPIEGTNAVVQTAFDDMTVFRDQEGNFKRLIRQRFAPGTSMKDLPEQVKEQGDFRRAYAAFLAKAESMKDEYGVVLDLTDSSAGMKLERGNVWKTGNVFVRFPNEGDPRFLFTVIDPDVFDTASGEHKFDPQECLRHRPGIAGVIDSLKVRAMNFARDAIVRQWQDAFVELSRQ